MLQLLFVNVWKLEYNLYFFICLPVKDVEISIPWSSGPTAHSHFFIPGMGPMPWTINSEIYPLWARSTGNACAAGVNWTFNILVSLTFLHLAQYITYYGQFQCGKL